MKKRFAAFAGTVRRMVRTVMREVRRYAWAAYMGGLLSVLHVHWWQWQFYAAMIPMCLLVSLRPNVSADLPAIAGKVRRDVGGAA